MQDKLKIQDVKGTAIIDFVSWQSAFNNCTVYCNGWDEKELVILVQDKDNPGRKIQLTFEKPIKPEEKDKPEVKEEIKPE